MISVGSSAFDIVMSSSATVTGRRGHRDHERPLSDGEQ